MASTTSAPFSEFFSLHDKMLSVPTEGHKLGSYFQDGKENYLNSHLKNVHSQLQDFFGHLHPFFYGGLATLNKGSLAKYELQMKLPDDNNWTHIGFLDGFFDATKMIPFCNIAPFGDLKTGQTVVDDTVRKAWECNIVQDRIRLVEWDTISDKVNKVSYLTRSDRIDSQFSFISQGLLRDLQKQFNSEKLVLKPYKMNIYDENGFFKGHVDTPTDAKSMIGTLVVCLPSFHQGGQFVLHKTIDDITYFVKYDMASLLDEPLAQSPIVDTIIEGTTYPTRHPPKYYDQKKIPFISFYADNVHEVQKITQGHRITLTFSVLIDENYQEPEYLRSFSTKSIKKSPITSLDRELASKELWKNILKAFSKSEEDEEEDNSECQGVGFLLQHNYTSCALDTFNDPDSWGRLKHYDNTLKELLFLNKPENIEIHACTIIRNYYHTDVCGEQSDDDSYEHEDDFYSARYHDFVNEPKDLPSNLLFVPMPQHSSGYYLKHQNDNGAEYTGNETRNSEEEYLYFTGAILVYPKQTSPVDDF